MTSQLWVAEKITPILAKTPNTTAKKLKVDLEKDYPIQLKYTTVWKAKQRVMKRKEITERFLKRLIIANLCLDMCVCEKMGKGLYTGDW